MGRGALIKNINQEQTGGEEGFNQEQIAGEGGFNTILTKNRQVGRGL